MTQQFKSISFTTEEKSLIWTTKLQPARATEAEANVFIKVCEEYGLNPLLGDITFQKFETKYGPRVSYLVSRDARLKHAMKQDDFVNCLSGVVKEGDYFEVNVAEGIPVHKFGSQRGKILGAWAVVKTKTRGNTIVFPDFAEYYAALSDKNPVWKNMPSAMIEKVAQSQALSRTFPLGVVFASEDEIIEIDPVGTKDTNGTQPESSSNNTSLADELKQERDKKATTKTEKESKKQAAKTDKTAKENKETSPVTEEKPKVTESTEVQPQVEQKVEEQMAEEKSPVKEETNIESEPVQQTEENPEPIVESPKQEETPVSDSNANVSTHSFEFIEGIPGKSGSGTPFLRVLFKDANEQREVFARGEEKIAIFDEFVQGTKFTAKFEDLNGFSFVMSAQAV